MFNLVPEASYEIEPERLLEHIKALIMATNAICVYASDRKMALLYQHITDAQAACFKAEKTLNEEVHKVIC